MIHIRVTCLGPGFTSSPQALGRLPTDGVEAMVVPEKTATENRSDVSTDGLTQSAINKKRLMNKDYQFLVGQQFTVGEDVYIVCDLSGEDKHTVVEAQRKCDSKTSKTFALSEVIEKLLVDEEIVLFPPNYLRAL